MPSSVRFQPDAGGWVKAQLTLSSDRDEIVVDLGSGYDDASVQITDASPSVTYGNVTIHVLQSNDALTGYAFDTAVTATSVAFKSALNVRGIGFLHVKLVPAAFPSTGAGVVNVFVKLYRRS